MKKREERKAAAERLHYFTIDLTSQFRQAQESDPKHALECRRSAERVLHSLSFNGARHTCPDPGFGKNCGWCSNLRTWRASVKSWARVEVLSTLIERQIRVIAASCKTSGAAVACVKEQYPSVRRDRVRRVFGSQS